MGRWFLILCCSTTLCAMKCLDALSLSALFWMKAFIVRKFQYIPPDQSSGAQYVCLRDYCERPAYAGTALDRGPQLFPFVVAP